MYVLKEITSRCAGALSFTVSFIDMVPPKANDTLSKGYQIHIKSDVCSGDRITIQNILNSHQLTMKEVGDKIIIYKPKNNLWLRRNFECTLTVTATEFFYGKNVIL